MRIERDMVGSHEIPEDAYYGLQSLRAAENFKITGTGLIPEFIESMAEIKKAAARTNCEIGKLDAAPTRSSVPAMKCCPAGCAISSSPMRCRAARALPRT